MGRDYLAMKGFPSTAAPEMGAGGGALFGEWSRFGAIVLLLSLLDIHQEM